MQMIGHFSHFSAKRNFYSPPPQTHTHTHNAEFLNLNKFYKIETDEN